MTSATDKANHTVLCCGAFIIWYAITVLVSLLPDSDMLKSQGLLMPLLCLLEFSALVSCYQWYRQRFTDIPLGKLRTGQLLLFCALLLVTVASQSWYARPESWSAGQSGSSTLSVVGFCLAVVLLAPVFEEILFRGFVLHTLLLWAPRQRLLSSMAVSILFAALHTQYIHLQTLISLTVLSLLLCAARLVAGGLKLPIVLHMLNNLLGVAPLLWHTFHR